jgi:outer membrane protein OmpA-like peptidoglycan-associated protein
MSLRTRGGYASSPLSALRAAVPSVLLAAFFLVGTGAFSYTAADTLNTGLTPPVQNYAEQAVPVPGAPQGYYNSPLAAGTLTLQDVLEAHKPNPENSLLPPVTATPSSTATAPMLTPPPQESSTSLMMSQGMRAVLQKVGETSVNAPPAQMRMPSLVAPSLNGQAAAPAVSASAAQLQPIPLVPAAAVGASASQSIAAPVTVGIAPGVKYEPGQEPKNLATIPAATGPAVPITPSASQASTFEGTGAVPLSSGPVSPAASASIPSSSTSPTESCDQNVQKWEKSCADAGYPATYVGKILGETHSGCADGQLHDVWVSNTCAPADMSTAQSPAVDGTCGSSSNNQFDQAPTANLCAQGIASTVSGDGPWTWACSGVNGGQAAACTAGTHVAAVNGTCGPANGAPTSSAPYDGLCSNGSSTAVRGTGPWNWSCRGSGSGSTQSCVALVAAPTPMPASPPASAEDDASLTPAPMPSVAMTPSQRVAAASEMPEPAAVPEEAAPPAPVVHRHAHVGAAEASTPSATNGQVIIEKGELCGAAAEILAYEAPDHDLCRIGSASAVNGDGPWTWSCTDNEGRTSACRTLSLSGPGTGEGASEPAASSVSAPAANAVPSPSNSSASAEADAMMSAEQHTAAPEGTELACGVAAISPAQQAPSDELCVNGSAGTVRGSGPWHWTCTAKGHKRISCETPRALDARCGMANGASLKSTPFSGLCSAGTPGSIQGSGPWTWSCNGAGGGVNVSCAASAQAQPAESSIDGACGNAANTNRASVPTSGLCAGGAPSNVSGSGPWSWTCSGINGGTAATCAASFGSATRAPGPQVNGVCGEANGFTTAAQPVEGLCTSGTVTAIVGNGPWNWSCMGENGGMTVSCTAPLEPPAPVDGICGAASGAPSPTKPQSALCSSGITGTVSGRGPWTWTCSGANGGSPASCVAAVAGKYGSLPSLTTPGSTQPPSPSAPPQSNALVTPRLAPSRALNTPPVASRVPEAASVAGADAPMNAPDIGAENTPVPPPSVGNLTSDADMQAAEGLAQNTGSIPGNHLTLDPTISTILFTRGSGNIDEQVLSTLDKLASVLSSNPDVRISLIAYADNSDSTPRDARRLSLTRALAVRDYLASKGVQDSRVDVRAEGANTTSGYIDRVDVKVND